MHWSEWAALVLLIVCAVPVLIALGYFVFLAWGLAVAALESRKPLQTFETPFGKYVKHYSIWTTTVDLDGTDLQVMVDDTDDTPDPVFLGQLPTILEQLPQLQETARQQVSSITERHQLSTISDCSDSDADFTLGFDYEEADEHEEANEHEEGDLRETINVDFREGKVVDWSSCDYH